MKKSLKMGLAVFTVIALLFSVSPIGDPIANDYNEPRPKSELPDK